MRPFVLSRKAIAFFGAHSFRSLNFRNRLQTEGFREQTTGTRGKPRLREEALYRRLNALACFVAARAEGFENQNGSTRYVYDVHIENE